MERSDKVLKLVSPIPVSTNHYMGIRSVMKNGKPVAMSYKTAEAVRYKKYFQKYVEDEAEKQGWEMSDNPNQHYYVDTVFYFPRKHMDANNHFKIMLDAITESQSVWIDDSVVCERVQRVYYDPNEPRVELEIYPVDYIGIFEDVSQAESFREGCIGCWRNKRNCMIRQNAFEGRLQESIKNNTCSAYSEKCRMTKHDDEQMLKLL